MSNVNVIGARKAARSIARTEGIPHQQALDRVAGQKGFRHWGDLLAAAGPAAPSGDPAAMLEAVVELAAGIGVTGLRFEQFRPDAGSSGMRTDVHVRIDGVRRLVHSSAGRLGVEVAGMVASRAGRAWSPTETTAGMYRVASGMEAGYASVACDPSGTGGDPVAMFTICLPWRGPAGGIDDLGLRQGDGWEAVMAARTGLVVIAGLTGTLKTTMARLIVEERRRDLVDAELVDDVRDQQALLDAIRASHERLVVVVLHARGVDDALVRLSALSGGMPTNTPVVAVIANTRAPRRCGACEGQEGCDVCAGTGTVGSGVVMTARKMSGIGLSREEVSRLRRSGEEPVCAILPAVRGETAAVADRAATAAALTRLDGMLAKLGRTMPRRASRRDGGAAAA